MTATFFAVSEQFSSDGAIYIHVMKKDYNPKVDDPFSFKGVGVFFPKGLSARIISQRGLFTICGTPSISLDKEVKGEFERVIIAKSAKQDIIRSLDRYGVNELTIFQDLDSLSNYLNSYVQKLTEGEPKFPLLINNE